jgi:hypothetical protein
MILHYFNCGKKNTLRLDLSLNVPLINFVSEHSNHSTTLLYYFRKIFEYEPTDQAETFYLLKNHLDFTLLVNIRLYNKKDITKISIILINYEFS